MEIDSPCIPDSVYANLPDFLKKCCNEFSVQREKDVFLTGALGVLSGCLESIKGRYHHFEYHANLYVIITAPSGSGKGALVFAKYLATPYHEKTRSISIIKIEDEKPVRKHKLLFIPGNTSAAMFYQHLHDNEGAGIFFQTELDTIINAQKQDWGNTSTELREAWHHDQIKSSRKGKGGEYLEINSPRISCVFSGTFNQVRTYLPSTENGLYSRFLFYIFTAQASWQSVKPCLNCELPKDKFLRYGEQVCEMIEYNNDNPADVILSDEQWNHINDYFEKKLHTCIALHGEEMDGLVKRMAVNVFRIIMIISTIRRWEDKRSDKEIKCSDLDFSTSMSLGSTYLEHLIQVYELTSRKSDSQSPKTSFFNSLPDEFETSTAIEIGKQHGKKQRTVEDYLTKLCDTGLLQRLEQGKYKKNDEK